MHTCRWSALSASRNLSASPLQELRAYTWPLSAQEGSLEAPWATTHSASSCQWEKNRTMGSCPLPTRGTWPVAKLAECYSKLYPWRKALSQATDQRLGEKSWGSNPNSPCLQRKSCDEIRAISAGHFPIVPTLVQHLRALLQKQSQNQATLAKTTSHKRLSTP